MPWVGQRAWGSWRAQGLSRRGADRVRVKRPGGAVPKRTGSRAAGAKESHRLPRSFCYLHAIIHAALSDRVRWGLVVRNVADAADPPSPQGREGAATADLVGSRPAALSGIGERESAVCVVADLKNNRRAARRSARVALASGRPRLGAALDPRHPGHRRRAGRRNDPEVRARTPSGGPRCGHGRGATETPKAPGSREARARDPRTARTVASCLRARTVTRFTPTPLKVVGECCRGVVDVPPITLHGSGRYRPAWRSRLGKARRSSRSDSAMRRSASRSTLTATYSRGCRRTQRRLSPGWCSTARVAEWLQSPTDRQILRT